jgi:hypothetical protein
MTILAMAQAKPTISRLTTFGTPNIVMAGLVPAIHGFLSDLPEGRNEETKP